MSTILEPSGLHTLEGSIESLVSSAPLHVAIDTETTRVTPARGFNPFYGVRAALIQLSWNDDGAPFDVAIPTRMKPGVKAPPTIPKGASGKASREAWKAAHKLWLGDGDAGHLIAADAFDWNLSVESVDNLDPLRVIKVLNALTDAGVVWVLKNMKFDTLMLMADGWVIPPPAQMEDAEVQSHLTEDKPWQQGVPVSHKLQPLAERHLGREPDASNALEDWFDTMNVKKDMRDYSAVPLSILAPYGCQDTRDTLDLYYFFEKKMEDMDENSRPGKRIFDLYREEILTLHNLVSHTISDGCAVNQGVADGLLEKYRKVRRVHEAQLFELAGHRTVEWNSNDQLAAFLFDAPPTGLGIPLPEFAKTATGKRSVSKGVLEDLDTPLTNELLKWRQAETFVTSFLEPIARFNIDGFIHPDFWLTTARTGRMSCTHPNFQNRPSDAEVRAMFVPRKGYVFLDLDYDQIEMRIAAHYAGMVVAACPKFTYQSYWDGKPSRMITSECYEAKMATMFNEDDDYDPHMTMVERSGLPRKRTETGMVTAKEANFAILYGVGIKGMGRNFGWEPTKAKKIKGAWRKSYPEIVHLQHYLTNILMDRGWIANEFGRRYYVDRTYLGLNYLIQGCAGDLMKRAMNRVFAVARELRLEHGGAQPMFISNVVHDELVLEVREDLLTPQLAQRVADAMTDWQRDDKPIFRVPISVGCDVSEKDWGSLEPYEMAA